MPEQPDWTLTTWEGSRRQQHREFLALSFRERLQILEDLGEVASVLTRRVRERGGQNAGGVSSDM